MANFDSTTVAGLEAIPSRVANADTLYGKQRALVESVEVLAGHNDGDTYTLFPVSLDARVDDLQIAHDGITGGTDFDFGFHQITDNELGAVIDKDIVADGVSLATTRASWESVMFAGSGSIDRALVNQRVWQILGYSSVTEAREANQNNQVYFVATANTVGSADGTLSAKLVLTVE